VDDRASTVNNRSMAAPRLHVEVDGNGSTVVLAHGFGGSARNFGPQMRALKDRF
jgi:pimeloyl-ACP methyl ester carboxylesterase